MQRRSHAAKVAIEVASTETFDRERAAAGRAERNALVKVLLGERAQEGDQLVGVSPGERNHLIAADPGDLQRLQAIARVEGLRTPRDRDGAPDRPDPVGTPFVSPGNVMSDDADRPAFRATGRLPVFLRARLDEGDEV